MNEQQLIAIIMQLSNMHFEVLCRFYLQGKGYICQYCSTLPGKRDKGRDIWGQKGIERFEAHCKQCSSSSLTKKQFKRALKVAASHHSESGATPPETIALMGSWPIFGIEGSDHLQDDPDKTSIWKENILKELQCNHDCYKDHSPTIEIINAGRMVSDIIHLKANYQGAIRFLRNIGERNILLSQDFLFDDDFEEESYEEEKKLNSLTKRIKSLRHLPKSMVNDGYDSVLYEIVNTAGNNMILVQRINDIVENLPDVDNYFFTVFKIYKDIVCENTSTINEFCKLIEIVIEKEKKSSNGPSSGYRLSIIRILKNIFYEDKELLSDVSFLMKFEELISLSYFWWRFAVDLYYRTFITPIPLPHEFINILKIYHQKYRSLLPSSPLSKISDWITDPIKIAYSSDTKSIINDAHEAAKFVNDIIEVKWIIIGLKRLLYLMLPEESGSKALSQIDESIDSILSAIPHQIYNSSPFLQGLRLKGILFNFYSNLDIKKLHEFEYHFKNNKKILLYNQVRENQINYVGCVYGLLQAYREGQIEIQYEELTSLAGGTLFPYRKDIEPPDPRNNFLFSFSGIEHLKQKIGIPKPSRKIQEILNWLENYAQITFRTYLKPKFKANNFLYFHLLPARQIQSIRQSLHSIIVNHLEKLHQSNSSLPPTVISKQLRVFVLVADGNNIQLFIQLIEKALESTEYEVLRSSISIWHLLYLLDRYSQNEQKEIITTLINKTRDRTNPGVKGSFVSWAYAGAISVRIAGDIETQFLCVLAEKLIKNSNKGIVYEKARFSSEVIELIRQWAQKNSLLALALREDTLNPEIWNLLGTSLLDFHSDEIPLENIKKSIEFYRLAFWLSKEKPSLQNPKFGYHFIERISELYSRQNTLPTESDLYICIQFYKSNVSQAFHYKEERSKIFFELIEKNWNSLSLKIQTELLQLLKIRWIKKLINDAVKL